MKEAKHKWNMAKKSFKRRQTPINLKVLKEMETEFIDKQARAKEEWTI